MLSFPSETALLSSVWYDQTLPTANSQFQEHRGILLKSATLGSWEP